MTEPIATYTESLLEITADSLRGGFFVDWPNPPSPETHLAILRGSSHAILALDHGTGMVVGFITAISDGVLMAYIPLLEVLPAWQGRGIGSALVEKMLARLQRLYGVDLLCDVEMQSFYARFGMTPTSGMLLRRYALQTGADAARLEHDE